jgi:hypothetical protein
VHSTQSALNNLQNLCLGLVRLDQLIFQHFTILPISLTPTIDRAVGTTSFLTHVTNLFANFHIDLYRDRQEQKFYELANRYYSFLKDNKEHRNIIDTNMSVINTRMKAFEKASNPTLRLGKKAQLQKQKAALESQQQVVDLVTKQHQSEGIFDINVIFTSIIDLKNLASIEWEKHKNLDAYVSKQRETHQRLCQLEDDVARHIKRDKHAAGWSTECYKVIYSYISDKITLRILKQRMDEFLTVCLSVGDYTGANLRLHTFVELMGGNPSQFESVPNDLKFRYAAVKYFLGEPEVWEKYINKEIAEQDKKREARKKQKDKQKTAAIKEVIAKKAAETQATEEQTQTHKKVESTRKPHALAHETTPAAAASSSSSSTSTYQSYDYHDNTTSELKKTAQEQIEAEERRLALKAGKKEKAAKDKKNDQPNNIKNEQNQGQTNQAPAAPAIKEAFNIFTVSKSTQALYENLYGLDPKLTTEGAIQLLAGFGLTVHKEEGKGSHTKCFLNSGEKILDSKGKLVWTCPDFEKGLMTIVPRWDSKDIPYYMVKNLRYIIEKMGIKYGATKVTSSHEQIAQP